MDVEFTLLIEVTDFFHRRLSQYIVFFSLHAFSPIDLAGDLCLSLKHNFKDFQQFLKEACLGYCACICCNLLPYVFKQTL